MHLDPSLSCIHHKISSQGIAQLVVTAEIEEVLLFYYETICTKLVPEPGNEDGFF